MPIIDFQSLKLVTSPAVEPVTLAEAKSHCRVHQSMTEDNTLLESLIVMARQHAEDVTRRALITQTLDLKIDDWPCGSCIFLPRPPLISVTSISYTLEDASVSTMSSADYVVDTDSEPPRVLLKPTVGWPSDALQVGPSIAVRFVAGYGAAASAVPQPIRLAMLQLIGHWYKNREAVIDVGRRDLLPVPMAVDSLLMPLRFWP